MIRKTDWKPILLVDTDGNAQSNFKYCYVSLVQMDNFTGIFSDGFPVCTLIISFLPLCSLSHSQEKWMVLFLSIPLHFSICSIILNFG